MPVLKPYNVMIGTVQGLIIDIQRHRAEFGAEDNHETRTMLYAIQLLEIIEDMFKDVK